MYGLDNFWGIFSAFCRVSREIYFRALRTNNVVLIFSRPYKTTGKPLYTGQGTQLDATRAE